MTKKYNITYLCNNCGCSQCESFVKGKIAPQTLDCKNCGCIAQKLVGGAKPKENKLPDYPLPIPQSPEDTKRDIYPWERKPWVLPDKHMPWDKYPMNENKLDDGHWTICSSSPRMGMGARNLC